jgi:8-oxo-dGTP pyrophosphatase MutT (NUDIX family)
MPQPQAQPVAAVILMAPTGRALMLRRAASGQWLFPASKLGPGESLEDAAWRAVYADTQYRLGDTGRRLMRRVKDDGDGLVDAVTYVCSIESEFTPVLSAKHDQFAWMAPKDVIAASKGGQEQSPDQSPEQSPDLDLDPDAQFLADLEGPAQG